MIGGGLPPALGSLRLLEILDLRSNLLKGDIPDEFEGLTRLRHLDLSRNGLGGHLKRWPGFLTSLVTLSLHHNRLRGFLPRSLGSLRSLEYLQLSHNTFVEDPFEAMQLLAANGAERLREIALHKNHFFEDLSSMPSGRGEEKGGGGGGGMTPADRMADCKAHLEELFPNATVLLY